LDNVLASLQGTELVVGIQDEGTVNPNPTALERTVLTPNPIPTVGDDHYRDLAHKLDLQALRRELHKVVEENSKDAHSKGALLVPLIEALGFALGIKHARMGFLGINLEGHEKQALIGIFTQIHAILTPIRAI